MAVTATDHSVSLSSSGYTDGLGRRVLEVDRETGEMIERLVVRPELTAFEHVLTTRVARGATLKDDRFAQPRDVSWDDEGHLTVTSKYVNGRRLSDVIDLACFAGVIGGIDASIGLLLELLPALSFLHSEANFAHGLLGTGRLTVTPSGSLVVLDWVYGATVEHLHLTRQRLWDELGIAAHPTPGPPRLDLASDLTQSAMIAAALIVGRPLGDKDYPGGIPALRAEIVEVAQIRGNQEFSRGIERYFERALPIRTRRVFASADEALFELRMLLKNSIGVEPCRAAFREFLREAEAVDPEGVELIARLEGPSHEHRTDDQAQPAESEKTQAAASKAPAKGERAPIRVERYELERIAVEQVEQERRAREEDGRAARQKADAERLERDRIERERAVREMEELQRMAREKAEADRIARQAEAERLERERLEAERLAQEKAEAERRAREKVEAERREREKAEAERRAREQAEVERLERERAEADRVAREKAEAERVALEKAEAERIAREKAEAVRAERERAEARRIDQEKAEAERIAREKAEAERIAQEKVEAERLAREKAEAERIAKDLAEAERAAKEKAEAERIAREKAEAERVAQERAEAERLAREKAEAERIARELAEAERAAKEKAEADRIAREAAEAERIAKENAEAEAAKKAEAPLVQAFDGRRRRKKDRSGRARKDRLRSSRTPPPEPAAEEHKPSGSSWLVRPDHVAAFDPPVAEPPKPPPVQRASDTGRAVAVAPGLPLEPTVRQSGPQPIFRPPTEAPVEPPPSVQVQQPAQVQPPAELPRPIQLKPKAPPTQPAGKQPDVKPTFQTIKLKSPAGRPHGSIKRASARPFSGAHPLPQDDFPQEMYDAPGGERRMPWKVVAAAVVILAGGGYAAFSMWPVSTAKPAAVSAAATAAPAAATVASTTGRVEIATEPAGARVLFDGKPAGVSPASVPDVSPGRHVVTVLAEAGTVKRTVKVEAGATARVEISIFSGFAAISAPIIVEVSEGGRNLGTSENHIMLTPGRHELRLTNKDLHYTTTETVDVEPGEVKEVKLDPKGAANINAQPWAEVWIDGTRVGDTPIANLELPLGSREIVFRNPQFGERKVMATITAGSPASISVDLSK